MSQAPAASPDQAATDGHTPYRIKVHNLEVCNCNHGCGCQFAGFPDHGGCEALLGYEVIEGEFGDVDLTGARTVIGAKWPGAIHEGGGHVVMFVEEDASDEVVEALATIFSGQAGGMPWEALGATIERLEGPVRASIRMNVDGKRSTFSVPDAVDVRMTPLINPVSEEEQEVSITYPDGGFMWDDGRVGTTAEMQISHGDMEFAYPGRFAAYATPTWTNQA